MQTIVVMLKSQIRALSLQHTDRQARLALAQMR